MSYGHHGGGQSPYPPAGGGGYGAPQQSYGGGGYGQPQQHNYGGGPPQNYGAPPPGQYGAPAQHGYGAPPPQQGGYGSAQPGFAPPGSNDPQLRQWFSSVDTDRSGAISQVELKQALVNGDWTPFSDETIKMLLNMFDVDRSGTIGFNEFAGLWAYIKQWQDVFRRYDRDGSGSIDRNELGAALSSFGYHLSPPLVTKLAAKYDPPPVHKGPIAHHGPPRGVGFDGFVRCCVTVKQLTESFKRSDPQQTGYVNFGYEHFMDVVISAP